MAGSKGIGSGRTVLLTFDDGPEPVTALDSILRTLVANNILAEFYVIGVEVKSSPARARAIVDKGHTIQNHSWSHINLETAPEASVRDQVRKTQDIIREATGVVPTKLRPPYGAGGWARRLDPEIAKVARELSLKVENWDVDTEDWKAPQGLGGPKVDAVRRQIERTSAPRLVVLMHVQPATARDLPQFIATLKGWGFGFAKP